MVPMFIGGWELLVVLALALLLFGGAKLAGLGKGAGRAIREFKEETKGLSAEERERAALAGRDPGDPVAPVEPREPLDPEQRRDR